MDRIIAIYEGMRYNLAHMMEQSADKRVIVAMSGGVDSSVAAALLVRSGYQVEGLMLRLWNEPAGSSARVRGWANPISNRCCTPDQVRDAQRVAHILNIPFHTLDVTDLFRQTVVEDFIQAYAAGLTPNPCLACNRRVRFGFLLEHAIGLGADYLATGHYVRLAQEGTQVQLLCGVDASKDQSYVLYMLQQAQLAHLLFPAGRFTKTQIRAMAAEWELPVASKPDSQDICFLADGDYRRFLLEHIPEAMQPGPIVDQAGRILGEHQGLPGYTIGQRKGIGVSAPEPLYVLRTDPAQNTLVVGPRGALKRRELTTARTQWVAGGPPAGVQSFGAEVKIRYRARPAPATITHLADGHALVQFDQPLSDITAGQAAVFYHNQVCLGGGMIAPQERSK